ncbi:unnamed protein product [Ilex paraguariensis]|uniref:SCP domain-containing protein n=1 Tax=Ilex paraguariensis TaxID=185542 RepID=A0ABC8T2T2_9AQUA
MVNELRLCGKALYAGQYTGKHANDCELVHCGGDYGENMGKQKPVDPLEAIVWKGIVRLGCARVECNNGDVFAICSYDLPGNYIGERPFGDNYGWFKKFSKEL